MALASPCRTPRIAWGGRWICEDFVEMRTLETTTIVAHPMYEAFLSCFAARQLNICFDMARQRRFVAEI